MITKTITSSTPSPSPTSLTSSKSARRDDLLSDTEGNGFIEKLIIIGLFIFVVAGAVTVVADAAGGALSEQGAAIGTVPTALQ